MAKGKTLRNLAGLAALGAVASMGASAAARSKEDARRAAFAPDPPKPGGREKTLEELREESQRRIELLNYAQGKPAISPEEHANTMHDIRGVRDGSGIPIRAGDGVLQEANPSMRAVRAQTPARFGVDTPLEMKHLLGRDLATLNPREFKKGGAVKMKKGGAVKMKSASARADGIAKRGKTKGRIV